jgi:PLP dependent protein
MIENNIRKIREEIQAASQGRPVKIVAVSKTVPSERIEQAHRAGLEAFGENRIQEALPKIQQLAGVNIEWHFIGHLQTNKASEGVRNFSWIHSVDSVKLLTKIEQEAEKMQKSMKLLFELNLAGEESKHGFKPETLGEGLSASKYCKWSKVCGFMIIPPYSEDPEQARPYFRQVRELLRQNGAEYPELTELSMGMSHDYRVAVEEGASMVRIGTLIFGERTTK